MLFSARIPNPDLQKSQIPNLEKPIPDPLMDALNPLNPGSGSELDMLLLLLSLSQVLQSPYPISVQSMCKFVSLCYFADLASKVHTCCQSSELKGSLLIYMYSKSIFKLKQL